MHPAKLFSTLTRGLLLCLLFLVLGVMIVPGLTPLSVGVPQIQIASCAPSDPPPSPTPSPKPKPKPKPKNHLFV